MEKKRIKMLKSEMGSEDGFTTKRYNKGKTYYVSPELGSVFVEEMQIAKYIEPMVRRKTPGTSAAMTTPETLSIPNASLDDPPRTWKGIAIRRYDSDIEAVVVNVLRGGKIQLSNGEIVSYRSIRKDWEIINDN